MNDAARQLLGLSLEQQQCAEPLAPFFSAMREAGVPLPVEDCPTQLLCPAGGAIPNLIVGVELPAGARRWLRLDAAPLPEADGPVGLSVINLIDVTDHRQAEQEHARLVETVLTLLDSYEVPPSYLRVELTESCIMSDQVHTLEVLTRLARASVSVSVDDFGTGYSSLAYLTRLPVDTLKIHKSFVQEMAAGEASAVIVRSTITMAHSLGLRVVAEGVEDRPAWEMLSHLHCDAAQGYYLSRPLPAAELEEWLRRRAAA